MTKSITVNRERGGVSMMSVMFFVLFLSILAVSFLRITNDEKQRSIRNELSTAALSAAEAGVEDAKRVLLYCMDPAVANTDEDCQNLESASCTDIINNFNTTSTNARKQIITKSDTNNGDAVVATGGAGDATEKNYQQYYTCLQINRYTSDLEFSLPSFDSKALDSSASVVFPLSLAAQTENGYKTNGIELKDFVLQWHLVGGDQSYDGDYGNLQASGDVKNPAKSDWTGPAMMRIEMIAVKKGSFSIDDLNSSNFAVILRPTKDGGDYTTNDLIISAYAVSSNPNDPAVNQPLQNVKCYDHSVSSDGYQCLVRVSYNGSTMQLDQYDYYIRLTSIYRDSHVNIGHMSGAYAGNASTPLVFNALQPAIDVTGRVNNSYRRLIARVAPNASLSGNLFFPEYAIESGSSVCKQMIVDTQSSGNSRDLCMSTDTGSVSDSEGHGEVDGLQIY